MSLWQVWWRYPIKPTGFDHVYHGFNLLEGTVWCLLACLVLLRWGRSASPNSDSTTSGPWREWSYAAAFATFGGSDFIEAYQLTTWLLLVKGVNLAALVCLRRSVMRRYPEAKVY